MLLTLPPQSSHHDAEALTGRESPDVPIEARDIRSSRRGATALEYLVMITFILVAMILAIQHFGTTVKGIFTSNANATSKTTPGNSTPKP